MSSNTAFFSFFQRVALLVLALGLGACAGIGSGIGKGGDTHYMLNTKTACCDSFEAMQFKMLPAEKKVRLAIDAADPSFQFKGGHSHYEALALPKISGAYLLQLESEVVKAKRGDRGGIFYPVVAFLDKDKQQIASFNDLPYTFHAPFYGRNHIRASIRVADKLADARYIVVYTNDERADQAIATTDGKSILKSSGFNTMLFAPITKPRYRIDFARQGWLRVLAYTPKIRG